MAAPELHPGLAQTRTVERALALLAEVCDDDAVSLADAARRVGLPPSTALRHLRTLVATGFVARDADGAFRAGPRMIQLGAITLGRQSLVRLAEPALRRLVAATGESAYVSVRGANESAIYLGVVEGTHHVRHTSWVGRAVPMRGLAVGEALLGRAPRGWVGDRDATDPDVTAIAAPVRRAGGTTVAALSLVGPTFRIDDVRLAEFGHALAVEARQLSHQLGVQGEETTA